MAEKLYWSPMASRAPQGAVSEFFAQLAYDSRNDVSDLLVNVRGRE